MRFNSTSLFPLSVSVCLFQKSDSTSERDSYSKDVKVKRSCFSVPLGPLNSNNALVFKTKLSDGEREALNLLDSDSAEQQEGNRRGRVRSEAPDRSV